MTKTQIIGAIKLHTGKSVQQIAKENGYGKMALYNTINGFTKSPVARSIIVKATGFTEDQLWPEN